MKNVFRSKIVWFNIFATLAEFGAYSATIVPQNWLVYVLLIQGLGNIVLRIWFTDKPLTFRSV